MAPGGNINFESGHALFEATHGTAPKYAGLDKVNPGSLILSGEMMLNHLGWVEAADRIVAGMEGALPSVIGGLVAAPVIAVPTSVGYGASFEGLTALLAMLNSCAPGIGVVNIDNGFGAGYLAAAIARVPNQETSSADPNA